MLYLHQLRSDVFIVNYLTKLSMQWQCHTVNCVWLIIHYQYPGDNYINTRSVTHTTGSALQRKYFFNISSKLPHYHNIHLVLIKGHQLMYYGDWMVSRLIYFTTQKCVDRREGVVKYIHTISLLQYISFKYFVWRRKHILEMLSYWFD